MSEAQRNSSTGVLTVVLLYALFAGLWILLSDRLMGLLLNEPEALVHASLAKGWFFVAITSLLLYILVKRLVSQLDAAHRREVAYRQAERQPSPMLVDIVDASEDAIFAKDETGRYLLFNNAAARFVGKPAECVIGQDDSAIFPAAQAQHIMAIDRRVRASGQTETQEEVLDTSNGQTIFLATKGPLRTSDGRIVGTYGISRDITLRKQAEMKLGESQERLRLLVDHAPAALAMFDRDMRYLEVSQRWRDDYGLGEREIIGRSHYEIFPEIGDYWKAVHQRAMGGETIAADEDRFERLDGSVQWLRWFVRPWLSAYGTVGGIVIFSEDISQRKRAEQELKQRNEELERFNRAATERELRMIALKREVNELARAAGRPAPYDTSFADAPGGRDMA